MNTRKRTCAIVGPGLVFTITALLLGAAATLGRWYPILVMTAAAAWFAKIAFEDRALTAEERRIRACLRRTMP